MVGGHAVNVARSVRRIPSARGSFSSVRVDVLTKEYPPEVYGGAGVHVAELVRALRRSHGPRHARARLRRAARRGRHDVVRRPRRARGRQRRPARRSASTCRSSTAAPAPTSCTRTPGTPTSPGTSPRCCTASRTSSRAHSLEPLRPWKAEQLGGGYAVSSLGREDVVPGRGRASSRCRRRCATTCCASYPDDRPRPGPGRAQRHRHRRLGAASTTPTGCASSASTRTGRRSSSSAGSPGRRGCRSSCARSRSCRPTCSSCSAPARRTPPRSRPR